MTRRPRILIPCNFRAAAGEDPEQAYLNDAYVQLAHQAGALVILAPPIDPFEADIADAYQADGLLLTGGNDLDASLYGQENHPKATPLHPHRAKAELAWFDWADRQGLPTLGICLGCQVINVARGGSLIQYLPESGGPVDHGGGGRKAFHDVTVEGDLLSSIVGERTSPTNSLHVQAVETTGADLRVAARAADGVVEAVEGTDGRYLLGVQWHPEMIPDRPASQAIIASFIQAAAEASKQ